MTHDFGLIQAPLDRVLHEFEGWQRTLGGEFARTEIASSLADVLELLLPLALRLAASVWIDALCPIWRCEWARRLCVSGARRTA